jgi:hypothetical protein
MLKAIKMIVAKGYTWDIANEIAIECFNTAEALNNKLSIESIIDKVEIYKGQDVPIYTMFNNIVGLPQIQDGALM